MIEIKNSEIHRYLGYQNIQPDETIQDMIESCKEKVIQQSTLRKSVKEFDLKIENDVIHIGTMNIHSKNLLKNLEGCDKVYLMGVTIGPAIDQLIRRSEVINMVEAAIYQAIGAAYVEAWADQVNQEVIQKMKEQGYYCRPRFSPGYGDFSLSFQSHFSQLLDLSHTTGIKLTDTLLMTPSKSVTAVIGCSKKETDCSPSGCEVCDSSDCTYRRD